MELLEKNDFLCFRLRLFWSVESSGISILARFAFSCLWCLSLCDALDVMDGEPEKGNEKPFFLFEPLRLFFYSFEDKIWHGADNPKRGLSTSRECVH